MFIDPDNFKYKYIPILSIRPSEMNALEELPDKDKDIILPIIPLRGWVSSQKLEKSTFRLEKSIEKRYWIADIDTSFIKNYIIKNNSQDYSREVYYEIEALSSPNNGYDNWYQYLKEFPKAIPTVQLEDFDQLPSQLEKLNSFDRGVVIKFTTADINSDNYKNVLRLASKKNIENLFVIFDYGKIDKQALNFVEEISSLIKYTNSILPTAIISFSCSSFPTSFANYNAGENPIYERLLFNKVSSNCSEIKMIFSDRGGARAESIGGGGGIPSPRIDYPLENDWRFIREEFEDSSSPQEGEKERLYTKVAKKIMASDYWKPDLHIWGTQIIEFTSKEDKWGINSPARATAVRLNLHMHQQLYYDAPTLLIDTDEDWED